MIRFLMQKLTHKKWLVLSLLIGNILLVAIAASHPMYKNAAVDRMFSDDFAAYLEEHNVHPAMISLEVNRKGVGQTSLIEDIQNKINAIPERLSVPFEQVVCVRNQITTSANPVNKRSGSLNSYSVSITNISDFTNHVEYITGAAYQEEIVDNVIEAVVSESVFIKYDIILGDEFDLPYILNAQGKPMRLRVVGIFRNNSAQDAYWVEAPNTYEENVFISQTAFDQVFSSWNANAIIHHTWYLMLDTNKINPRVADTMIEETKVILREFEELSVKKTEPVYLSILSDFKAKENKVSVTLMILQVPIMVLLCAFLFMISSQMLSIEQNEISMFKSRGASGLQIFTLYLLQSVFLTVISVVIGLFLGRYMCQVLGSSNAFLEFVQRRPLEVTIDKEVFLYTLAAMAVSIFMTTIPVISYSRVSIVNLKQRKARSQKKLWQKIGLDFIMLGVSLYGLYSFTIQREELVEKVINGGSLDPMLYFSASLFILGAGLVALRIQPLIVKLIFSIGKRFWKPQTYASFLQIIRTSSKQYFIMAFLILTVALGIFNATVARTILANAENNTRYQTGADLVLAEQWKSNEATVKLFPGTKLEYYEPSLARYDELTNVAAMARVRINEATLGKDKIPSKVMGIDTKEFGSVCYMEPGLLKTHINNYLNALASNQNAVLLSENYRTEYGIEIGDSIYLTNTEGVRFNCTVYGFFDYWPSYSPTTMVEQADGTRKEQPNYLAIANINTLNNVWDLRPYELWFKLNGSSDEFYEFATKNKVEFTKFIDMNEEVKAIRHQTLFQGTNGILTMSFIVILVLCGAGFLIYWIISIRSRELLFGVFRAMGMSQGSIIQMLLNEQLFSSLLSIGIGTGIGLFASKWFVPLIQIAYAAENQVLPLKLITQNSDMVRLFASIGVVFVVCMMIITRIIFSMKIAHALKLGED